MSYPHVRPIPQRREIWEVQLPSGGTLLAVVLSANPFNEGPRDYHVMAWVTRRNMAQRYHVELKPGDTSPPLQPTLFVKCDEIETIKIDRLKDKVGTLSEAKMQQIEDNLRSILGLPPYK